MKRFDWKNSHHRKTRQNSLAAIIDCNYNYRIRRLQKKYPLIEEVLIIESSNKHAAGENKNQLWRQ